MTSSAPDAIVGRVGIEPGPSNLPAARPPEILTPERLIRELAERADPLASAAQM
jgi:hypothetical protein